MVRRGFLALAVAMICLPAASAQGTKKVKFPDGSGSVSLPPGWKLASAGNGSAIIVGPEGEEVTLGMTLPVITRNVSQAIPGTGIPEDQMFSGSIKVRFDNPVFALIDLFDEMRKRGGNAPRLTRMRRVEAIEWPTGRAGLLQFSGSVGGKPIETYGLFAIQPVDNVTGLFYFTSLSAPSARYAKSLPTMLALWKSWGVSKATLDRRLEAASRSLAEVDWKGAIDGVTANRRKVAEEAARQFGQYLRQ